MGKKYLLISLLCITVLSFVGCAGANDGDNDLDMDRTGYDDNVRRNGDYNQINYNDGLGYDYNNGNGMNGIRNENGVGMGDDEYLDNYSRVGYDYPNNMGTTRNNNQNTPVDYNDNNVNNQSANVEDRIEDLAYVDDCSVVISDDTALVGLNLDENASKDEIENIKNTVASDVKTMCPWLNDVSVTENDDLFNRINNLSDDVNNGRTMDNVGNEIGNIVNDIVR